MKGGVEWQIEHKAKPSAVLDMRPHSKYCIICKSWDNSVLTDLDFCIGRISSNSIAIDPVCDVYISKLRW